MANVINDDDANIYRDGTRIMSPRERQRILEQSGLTSPQTNPIDDSDFERRSGVQISSYYRLTLTNEYDIK